MLKPGDLVGWRLTKGGGVALDVSVLFIDSEFKITPVFPRRGNALSGDNRILTKGHSIPIGPFPVNARTVGLEHLVVIAIPGVGQPIDFTCLAQPGLERAVERSGGKQALDSPLGRLLKHAMFAQRGTRGLDIVEADTQMMRGRCRRRPEKSDRRRFGVRRFDAAFVSCLFRSARLAKKKPKRRQSAALQNVAERPTLRIKGGIP